MEDLLTFPVDRTRPTCAQCGRADQVEVVESDLFPEERTACCRRCGSFWRQVSRPRADLRRELVKEPSNG